MFNRTIQLGAVSQESFVYSLPDFLDFANSESNAWPQITSSLNSVAGLRCPMCLPPSSADAPWRHCKTFSQRCGRRGGQPKCWTGRAALKTSTCCQSEAKAYVSLLQIFSPIHLGDLFNHTSGGRLLPLSAI